MTLVEKGCKIGWVAFGETERRLPSIGNRRQGRIGVYSQCLNHFGQWGVKVFVLTDAKAVSCHIDTAAEVRCVRIQVYQVVTLAGGEDGWEVGIAKRPELFFDIRPVVLGEPVSQRV